MKVHTLTHPGQQLGHEGGKLRVHCPCSGSSKGSGVGNCLLCLLLLVFLVLLAQEAVGGLVHGPHHVMFTPVVCVFAHFFLALLTVLQRLFLPGFILLLFLAVVSILLVLLLVLLVALFLSFICNSAEFGVQLELAFECIKGGGHHNNLLVVWGFGSPESFGLSLEACCTSNDANQWPEGTVGVLVCPEAEKLYWKI
jgi:hypothetical protein